MIDPEGHAKLAKVISHINTMQFKNKLDGDESFLYKFNIDFASPKMI